ncbi:MAG TPA: redoxin family protein [Hymenobacter sp.]|jgi:thiol-disulfide isomerase/thioredoxin
MQTPFFLGLVLSLSHSVASAQTALKVGDPLPDFVLPRVVNGPAATFSPAAAKDKVLVLEFWGTTCSPCIPALERLDGLQKRYPNDLQVVGFPPIRKPGYRSF